MIKPLREFNNSVKAGITSDHPMEVGRALTKLFLAVIVVLAFLPQHTQDDGWNLRAFAFLTAPANEIGDTFAGVAGVLAFLWIIITVWLQSQELSAQRTELELTRIEFQKMAEAQKKQAKILNTQSELLLDEQKQRREIYASSNSDALASHLKDLIADFIRNQNTIGFLEDSEIEGRLLDNLPDRLEGLELRELINTTGPFSPRPYFIALRIGIQNILSGSPNNGIFYSKQLMVIYENCLKLEVILREAGNPTQIKFRDYEFPQLLECLNQNVRASR
ncbi:hypothetical protein [Ruegeria sp. HKCCA4008]|uniref:hypothetical protein n=1 Tax=Ruegeria sp. HKCCA4008 TaxID=2682999 RepID=UPI001489D38D|nr:hypothetical protein [Ruegeria sp. HKCCA4008]